MKNLFFILLVPSFAYCQYINSLIESRSDIILNNISMFGDDCGIELNKKNKFTQRIHSDTPYFYYFLNLTSNELQGFFLFPSDSVRIVTQKNGSQILKGKNQSEYDLLSELSKNGLDIIFKYEGDKYSWTTNFENAFEQSKITYTKRKQMIESYSHSVRPQYYAILNTVNVLKRLDFLLTPYNPCSPVPSFTPQTKANQYFAEIDSLVLQLNQIEAKNLPVFTLWLSKIIINYANYSDRYLIENQFDYKFKQASIVFTGEIKDSYLTSLMLDKVNNKFVNTNYLTTYYAICTSEILKEKVRKKYEIGAKLSNNEILQNTYLSALNGKKIRWIDILKAQNGAVVYVDFWASWCAGCKKSIFDLVALKKQFPQLKIVSVSIDANPEHWHKALNSWGSAALGCHYRLDTKTTLATILASPTIPRYALIGKDGQYITIDAEFPNNTNLREQLKSLMK